jgi:hypothetical protein
MCHIQQQENSMFRKISIALAAVLALGVTALAPTTASATYKGKHWGHHGHGGWGYNYYVPSYTSYYGSCWVKRWVDTPYGPRLKRVYVCY